MRCECGWRWGAQPSWRPPPWNPLDNLGISAYSIHRSSWEGKPMRRILLKMWRRRKLHQDLDAELAFHRDMAREHNNPTPLGATTLIQEQALDLWRFTFLEN